MLESGAVRFERLLPGPIERVWAYLTEGDKRATLVLRRRHRACAPAGKIDLFFKHSQITDEPPPESASQDERRGRADRAAPITALRAAASARLQLGRHGRSRIPMSRFELSPQVGDKVPLVLTHRRLATKHADGDRLRRLAPASRPARGPAHGQQPRGFWSRA